MWRSQRGCSSLEQDTGPMWSRRLNPQDAYFPSISLPLWILLKVQLKFQLLKYFLTDNSVNIEGGLDCVGLSTLYTSFIFEFIFNHHVFRTDNPKDMCTLCIWHLYCLNCTCTEVLSSHLECNFRKGITSSISLSMIHGPLPLPP